MKPKYAAVALVGAFTFAGCGGSGNGAAGWSKLEVLAGQIGSGPGIADGKATAARFDFPQGLHTATDGTNALFITDSVNNTIRRMTIDGNVETIAGSPFVYGATDGTGAAASFSFPTDITDDGLGNFYIADADNHCIRKLFAPTGAVTTLAGQCGAGGSADGIGSTAQFAFPSGLTLVGGSLYVADQSTVRSVDIATGMVSTIAGDPTSTVSVGVDGTGTAAQFASLWGITNDGAGNLFLTDLSAGQVRQMNIASGAVTTIAGNGTSGSADGVGMAATFYYPQGIASDRAGNLYVADVNNNLVRKIVLGSNTVSTLAGSTTPGSADGSASTARFYQPSGLDFSGGILRVADALNNDIRAITLSSGTTTTIAGAPGNYGHADGKGTAASFNSPASIHADVAGDLFVADSQSSTIREISPSGVVTTLAGTPYATGKSDGTGAAARFATPIDVAPDNQGNVYIADFSNSLIRKLVVATGVVTTIAGLGYPSEQDGNGTQAGFSYPSCIALDGKGHLFIGEDANTIRKLDLATGDVTTFAGVAFTPGTTDGVGTAASLGAPFSLVSDGTSLYFTDGGHNTIRKIDLATATVTTIAGTAGQSGYDDGVGMAARFSRPTGLTLSSDGGTLYIADTNNSLVRQMVLLTGAVTTLAGVAHTPGVKLGKLPGGLNGPVSLAILPSGDLAVCDSAENAILVVE